MNAGTSMSLCAPGRATRERSPARAAGGSHFFIIKSAILTIGFALSLVAAGVFQPRPVEPELLIATVSQDEISTRDISDAVPEAVSLANSDDYVELLFRAGIARRPADRQ